MSEDALLRHDPTHADPGLAFSSAKLEETPTGPTPIGIFREVQRPAYRQRGPQNRPSSFAQLLTGDDTRTMS